MWKESLHHKKKLENNMAELISFTKVMLPYGWLGNMSPYSIVDRAMEFPTAEHHFQIQRLPLGHPAIEKIVKMKSPMAAKMEVRKHEQDFIVERLSTSDIDNMRRTIHLKFTQHPALCQALLATDNAPILEDVGARQSRGSAMFWGGVRINDSTNSTPWIGQNWLGRLLMELRELLRQGS